MIQTPLNVFVKIIMSLDVVYTIDEEYKNKCITNFR